jgi:SAM-dependent methyltransferase
VIANQLIEHLSDTDRFVKEVYRVLRVAGVFVCSTMNLASFHNIFSLVLGNQPFASHVSDEVTCGTLLDLEPRKDPNPYYGKKHRRVFTAPALKELLEFHGFKCESLTGWGLYPLPVAVGRFFRLPRYSVYLTVKARKPFS